MRIAIIFLVMAGWGWGQCPTYIPNTSAAQVRTLMNNNFSCLGTGKENVDPNIIRSSQNWTNPNWLTLSLTGGRLTGFGQAAAMNVGTTAGTVAAGNDPRFSSSGGGGSTAGLVPYTGATQNVVLGTFSLSAGQVIAPLFGGGAGTSIYLEGAMQAKPSPPPPAGSLGCHFDFSGTRPECQDSTGTIVARMVNINDPVFVPYTGALNDINMGAKNFTANQVSANVFNGPIGTPYYVEGAMQSKPVTPPASGSLGCWFDSTGIAPYCQDSTGTVVSKALNATTSPVANHAVCWKDSKTLGYCSTQPDASGICTCN